MKVDHPVIVHRLQLVEYFRRTVHVFLETNHYQLCHESPHVLCSGIRLRPTCNHASLADAAIGRGLLRSFSFLHLNVE